MNYKWFNRKGLFYIPTSWIGWWIFTVFCGFAVYIFKDIDSRSHSVSDTLINFVFNLIIIALCYTLVGFVFSERKPNKSQ